MSTLNLLPKRSRVSMLITASAILALPLMSGCDSADSSKTIGQKLDNAVSKTEQAAADVKDATKASVTSASVALREGADQAKAAAKNVAQNVTEPATAGLRLLTLLCLTTTENVTENITKAATA